MTPDAAAAATLVAHSGLGPRILRRLLQGANARQVLDAARSSALGDLIDVPGDRSRSVASRLAGVDGGQIAELCDDIGICVTPFGHEDFPAALAADPDGPGVLFSRGRPLRDVAAVRRVAVVGTRSATAAGRATATELGRGLANAGVSVVSGLALGIDGAAHRGAVEAATCAVAVVGHGLDQCYPRRHQALFDQMCRDHLVISEWPPGVGPEPWRFPLRNRIIAGLSDVVVVVESRITGGSLITARAALDRGLDVMVVPGSAHSPAAEGTNLLLRDGAGVVTCVGDVLTALDLTPPIPAVTSAPTENADSDELLGTDDSTLDHRAVAHLVGVEPCTLDGLVEATGLSVARVALVVGQLCAAGVLAEECGWFEIATSRLSGQHHP